MVALIPVREMWIKAQSRSQCMMRAERDGLRVMSIPGRRHAQNSYFPLLWRALVGAGIEMISARSLAALALRYDILHVHLPELLVEKRLISALIAGPAFVAYVIVARIAGKKFVWTMHEVTPTRPHLLTRPFLWCMRRLASAYVFINRTSEEEFFKRYPIERKKTVRSIPHSSYPVSKILAARRGEVRLSLSLDSDCLAVGFLGEIRPYKNPAALQYLPIADPEGRPVQLLIAGGLHQSCDIDEIEEMFRRIEPRRLTRVGERPSDERLSELIQTVDIVFMPYLRGWNSGFAMLALGCGSRLLCSDLPMFREIEEALGAPWVYIFDHKAAGLSQELAATFARITRDKPGPCDQARLDRFLEANTFERAALRHADLYSDLLGRRRVPLGTDDTRGPDLLR
jgi:glycosyltransferase involved in cell wall biosynthesis